MALCAAAYARVGHNKMAAAAIRGLSAAVLPVPDVNMSKAEKGLVEDGEYTSGSVLTKDKGVLPQQRSAPNALYASDKLDDEVRRFADETHNRFDEKDITESIGLGERLFPCLAAVATAAAVGIVLYKNEMQKCRDFVERFKKLRREGKANRLSKRKQRQVEVIDDIAHQFESDDVESLTGGQPPVIIPKAPRKLSDKPSETSQEFPDIDLMSMADDSGIIILSGSANSQLAHEVCAHLNVAPGRMKLARFADGEVSLDILDGVRSKDVYIFQSVPPASSGLPVHSTIMELLLAVSASRRANAERITAVLPYMAYSRQDEMDLLHPTPLAVTDVCILLHTLGVDRVLFLDVHGGRTMGYFPESIPVTNVVPHGLAVKYLQRKHLVDPVIVATDNNVGERAKAFWSRMKRHYDNCGIATVLSSRVDRRNDPHLETPIALKKKVADPFANEAQQIFVGNVQSRDCVVVDDIIDSGTRVCNAVEACKNAGAERVFVYCTHGLLSKGAVDRLEKSGAEEVIITNSIELPPNVYSSRIKVLNVSKLIAEVVRCCHAEVGHDQKLRPLSTLYRDPAYEKQAIDEAHQQ